MKFKIRFSLMSVILGLISLTLSVQTVGCSEQNFVREMVQLATNPGIFNVSPKTVTKYFKGFASLESKEKDNVEWIFTGTGPKKSPLHQIKARFQKDKKTWPLLVIRLKISPTKDVSYEKISGELTKKLKGPTDETVFDGRIRRVWQMSELHGLILEGSRQGKKSAGNLITLDIAVFQGEDEEY